MASTIAGFELCGDEGDETRVLLHDVRGYALAIPGHPRLTAAAAASPRYDALIAFADGPFELGVRMDEIPTAIEPDSLVPALATAYASSRAVGPAPDVSVLDGKILAEGANAGARANYVLRGDDAQAMEFLAITARRAGTIVHALHLTVRYRRGDTTPFEWANVRSALLTHQSWTPGTLPSTKIWPESAIVAPSVKLQLLPAATDAARAKAEEIGAMSPAEVDRIADLLLSSAGTDDAPDIEMHPFLHKMTARRVATCVPTRVAEVLLRDLDAVKSMHDFRGWCWQCFWAIGNRADLRKN